MGVKPIISTGTVTTAGTRVQATATNTWVTSIYFEAAPSSVNTGLTYIGDSTVSSTVYMTALAPGAGFTLAIDSNPTRPSDSMGGPEINLSTIYFDAATNGNKVHVTYLTRIGAS